jgi:hypothetical protein
MACDAAGNLNDLFVLNPDTLTQTFISLSGSIPPPRYGMGFAATPDGMLYVFGGCGNSGKYSGLSAPV